MFLCVFASNLYILKLYFHLVLYYSPAIFHVVKKTLAVIL